MSQIAVAGKHTSLRAYPCSRAGRLHIPPCSITAFSQAFAINWFRARIPDERHAPRDSKQITEAKYWGLGTRQTQTTSNINRPFARAGHMVQNKLCWDAHIWQWDFPKTKELLPVSVQSGFSLFESPTSLLHQSIIYSVPCDRILQRANIKNTRHCLQTKCCCFVWTVIKFNVKRNKSLAWFVFSLKTSWYSLEKCLFINLRQIVRSYAKSQKSKGSHHIFVWLLLGENFNLNSFTSYFSKVRNIRSSWEK